MKLTKEKADALCTMITFGFLKQEGSRIKIECEKQEEVDRNNEVLNKLRRFDSSHSVPRAGIAPLQKEMPLIVAKTSRVSTREYAESLTDDLRTFINVSHVLAKEMGDRAPVGAYMGGISKISNYKFIGASQMEMYKPVYRDPDDATVLVSYNNAVEASNLANACIDKASVLNGIAKVDVQQQNPAGNMNRNLFRSYHGMIRAMVLNHPSHDPNDYIFELALGPNTSKVSSCIPCSIFMVANSTPPTSTHLGRGDNWGIPAGCEDMRRAWEGKIKEYYNEAATAMTENPKIDEVVRQCRDYHDNQEILSNIFLEALTFEDSFITRINNTIQ